MSKRNWSKKPWYPYAIAGIIIVIAAMLLFNLGSISSTIRRFFGFFTPVFLAMVMAYMMNQLSLLYQRSVFLAVPKKGLKKGLSIALTVITVILFIVFLVLTLVPQLVDSVSTFVSNLDRYERSAEDFILNIGFFKNQDLSGFLGSAESLLDFVGTYLLDHLNNLVSTVASAGRGLVSFVISFILAVYLMVEKDKLRNGFKRLVKAVFRTKEGGYEKAVYFLKKCDSILTRFIVYNFLDCLIVGVANAIFMTIAGMPYIGLISVVVAVTNLVPTFGPIVGGVIGAVLLFLVNPTYALIFAIFTLALQTCDGYIIKPRLFGTTLGVSLAWILIAIIVSGRAFGVIGILLSIPGIAILDFIYQEYFMPWLENRKSKEEEQ